MTPCADRKKRRFMALLWFCGEVGVDTRTKSSGRLPAVAPRLLPAFRPGIQNALPSPTNWKQNRIFIKTLESYQ